MTSGRNTILRGTGLSVLLALAACADYQPPVSPAQAAAAAADPLYACQMRGAIAEDRVYGPFAELSIDTALLRNQVVDNCLTGGRRADTSTLPSTPARNLPGVDGLP